MELYSICTRYTTRSILVRHFASCEDSVADTCVLDLKLDNIAIRPQNLASVLNCRGSPGLEAIRLDDDLATDHDAMPAVLNLDNPIPLPPWAGDCFAEAWDLMRTFRGVLRGQVDLTSCEDVSTLESIEIVLIDFGHCEWT